MCARFSVRAQCNHLGLTRAAAYVAYAGGKGGVRPGGRHGKWISVEEGAKTGGVAAAGEVAAGK